MDKKMVPEVRFKGFTDDWELRKLKNLVCFSKGSGYSKKDLVYEGNPIILYGNLYTNYSTIINDVRTYTNKKNGSIISTGRDVIVPASGETPEDIARASFVEVPGIIYGGDLNVLTVDTNILYPSYLAFLLSNGKVKARLSRLAQGKSIVHLHNSDLEKISFLLPTYHEQKRISNILLNLEKSIALQQHQLDLYIKLKKGLLQKLFPKNRGKIPEVRFADFTGDWEQRKLKDLADVIGGGTPSTKIGEYWNGDIDWYSPIEIGKSIFVNHSQKKITKLGLSKSSAKILPINTLLFTSRAGIGNTAILKKEGTTNQGFQSIVPIKDKLDIYYLYSNSDKLKRYGERVGGGSTFTEVSGKQMKEMPITIPNIHEQENIGHIFQLLDFQMLLQENNLKELKQFKKFLLQKLFI